MFEIINSIGIHNIFIMMGGIVSLIYLNLNWKKIKKGNKKRSKNG